MLVLLRRLIAPITVTNPCMYSCFNGFCSIASPSLNQSDETDDQRVSVGNGNNGFNNHLRGVYGSSMLWHDEPTRLDRCEIEVVDTDTWRVSSGLASMSKELEHESGCLRQFGVEEVGDGNVDVSKGIKDDLDCDEIEDMRIRGNLFYKIDRGSMEYDEYKFDFHRRHSSSNKNVESDRKSRENSRCDSSPKGKESRREDEENRRLKDVGFVNEERLVRTIKENYIICNADGNDSSCVGKKKERSLTFNQLTGPYHEPFCLDIYVSKGSVRACVVHRATSKVVAVAHSISKDMRFDLGSAKSNAAAAAVGRVLAQRALGDDIHNVIFTPRKGDKLEGKLQIVLQSIIDNGVSVKVKLKEKNPGRPVGRGFN